MQLSALVAGLIMFCACFVQAEELDEALDGFEDSENVNDYLSGEIPGENIMASEMAGGWTGSLALSAGYNYHEHYSAAGTRYQGLQKLRTRINVQHDYEFNAQWNSRLSAYAFYDWAYALHGRGDYTDEVVSDYEREADIQELWFSCKLAADIDIKVGRQVVNWGRSDSLRVLDILNPLDNRELGLADIEDIRLPTTMVTGDFYFGEWNLSLISVVESRFSKQPPHGSDFEALAAPDRPGSNLRVEEEKPSRFGDESWAGGLTGIFSGWDISFHAARFWRDSPYLDPGAATDPVTRSRLRHSRITLLGVGGNHTAGSWLFKYELAWLDDIDYTTYASGQILPVESVGNPSGVVKKERTDILLGVEYYGFTDTTLTLEMVNRHISGYELSMAPAVVDRDSGEIVLRLTRSFLRDRLDVSTLISAGMKQNGGIARIDAEYELRDGLSLSGGVVYYHKGESPPFNSIDKNDRVFAEIKYSF